jgi:hypothetical protein
LPAGAEIFSGVSGLFRRSVYRFPLSSISDTESRIVRLFLRLHILQLKPLDSLEQLANNANLF